MGYLKPAGEAWLPAWTWRPHRLYRIGDLLYLKDRLGGIRSQKPKEGYINTFQASLRLNVSPARIVVLLKRGELEGYHVPFGMKTVSWFVLEASISRYIVANFGDGEALAPADGFLPPLICASDETCLQARRELWQLKGRKWGRKFWKGVDRRKQAG